MVCVLSGYIPNGMPPSEYVDAAAGAMMTSRPMTSLPPAMGGAKCQQPMGAQFSQQVCFVHWYSVDSLVCQLIRTSHIYPAFTHF